MHRHLTRRELLRRSAYLAGAIMLASCGPSKPSEAPTSAPATPAPADTAVPATAVPAETAVLAPAMAGEIEYSMNDFGPDGNKAREAAAKAFMEANPQAKINLSVLPGWEWADKFVARSAAGIPPDLIISDWYLIGSVLGGQMLDLTAWFDADPVLNKPELFTVDMRHPIHAKWGTSHMYSLIQGTWVPLLFYNIDLFDKTGTAYPTDDWTWDDVRSTAQALRDPDNGKWGLQIYDPMAACGWYWWETGAEDFWAVPQIFPEKTAFDSETGLKVFGLWRTWGFEDKSLIPKDENTGYTTYGGAFGAGDVGMFVGGDWDASWNFYKLPFRWGVVLFPRITMDHRVKHDCMYSTNMIAAKSKNPELAWAFTRYLAASAEGQTFVGVGAYETPVLKEAAHSDAVLKPEWAPPGYDARVRAAELPGISHTPFPFVENYYEFYDKYLSPAIVKVASGEVMPEDAAKQLDGTGAPYYQEKKAKMPPIP